MEVFNKVCMGLAFVLGLVLALLGCFGFFLGSSAHFRLPPVLGGLPLLIGWGIIVAVRRSWDGGPTGRPPEMSDGKLKPHTPPVRPPSDNPYGPPDAY